MSRSWFSSAKAPGAAVSDPEDLSGSFMSDAAPPHHSLVEPTVSPTNSEFMRLLLQAAPRGTYGWVCNFIGAPRTGADWGGRPYQGGGQLEQEIDTWHPYNTYFSVAALAMGTDGEQARKKALFSRLLALVVDDADLNELLGRPSYVLQTSPGKHQVGIFLDRDDPDCANLALIDALMRKLYDRGQIGGDPSGNNGTRYVRLPVGTNLKQRESGPFRHAMTTWNPEQRLTLADAAAVVGVDIDELRERAAASQAAGAGMQLGPAGAGQAEKLGRLATNILEGVGLHESINLFAASLVATGMHGGAAVNLARTLMERSAAPRDDRWQERYNDIPRSVRTAEEKFSRPQPQPLEHALAADVETTPEQAKPNVLIKASTFVGTLTPIRWLIEGYLEAGAMSMLFGPPGSCKSFVAIDQACCVVTGTPWHGNDVQQGPVVIVVGEGKNGIGRRIQAWEAQNNKKIGDAPLYITTKAIPFLDAGAALELIDSIDQTCRDLKVPPVMIVIDTLARNFGAGDENSAKDANAFIQVLDTHLRQRYTFGDSECHVVIVHHSGHIKGRERGSTAFPGAMDQRFEVQRFGDEVEYANRKMKDGEEPPSIRFSFIKRIYLGEVEGNVINGAALKRAGNVLDVIAVEGRNGSVTVGQIMKLVVAEKVPTRERMKEELGISNDGYAAAIAKCLALGLIEKIKGHNLGYKLTQEGRVALSHTGYMAMGGKVAEDEVDEDADGGEE
jgi:RecA-family ATPase